MLALDPASLSIEAGEFVTLLWPSGCGKTTLLRLLAGFDTPTKGKIVLNDADVTDVPPCDRDVNMVFQDYALFPQLSVGRNVAFGLERLKWPKARTATVVRDALEMVELAEKSDRMPHELSGGQRQRVALAQGAAGRAAVGAARGTRTSAVNALPCRIGDALFHGSLTRFRCATGTTTGQIYWDWQNSAHPDNAFRPAEGRTVHLHAPPADLFVFLCRRARDDLRLAAKTAGVTDLSGAAAVDTVFHAAARSAVFEAHLGGRARTHVLPHHRIAEGP
ncbi:ATP-binding cassette domain-containing protein [Primorskyibacter sp. 2E107]|uniref:polyamine ABC transporter ATP-binding protein n=1 Tax=Primorskyibacter sp. 2E107 TaxID=3403458 RepID=UPI003AF6C1C0